MRALQLLSGVGIVVASFGVAAAAGAETPVPLPGGLDGKLPLPGKVEQGLYIGRSICAASGLNDDPLSEEDGGLVQSYGQIVRIGAKAFVPSPGDACRGNATFEE